MALLHQPRDSSETLPALPISHSLAKPCRSPAESYCHHGRENTQLQMQAHSAAISGFSLCQETVSIVHQHPQTQGSVWGCTTSAPNFSWCLQKGSAKCTVAQQGKTWQTDKTLTKRPEFPKSLVLSWEPAEQFSPALKQEVVPSSQRKAESLWALRCCLNTGLSLFYCFYILLFLFFIIFVSWGVSWQPPTILK